MWEDNEALNPKPCCDLSMKVEEDNEALSNSLDQERRRRAAASGIGGSGPALEQLAGLPRDAWPREVRRLVELADAYVLSREGGGM